MSYPAIDFTLRMPTRADGPGLHALITRCPPLDGNSVYLYCILCDHHRSTCVVAEGPDSELHAALTAYRLPDQPDTLFVWQVAVDEQARGQGLAGRMLDQVLNRESCRGVQALETTVSPSNAASRKVFEKLAQRHQAWVKVSPYLEAEVCGAGHEAEELLHVALLSTKGAPNDTPLPTTTSGDH